MVNCTSLFHFLEHVTFRLVRVELHKQTIVFIFIILGATLVGIASLLVFIYFDDWDRALLVELKLFLLGWVGLIAEHIVHSDADFLN